MAFREKATAPVTSISSTDAYNGNDDDGRVGGANLERERMILKNP